MDAGGVPGVRIRLGNAAPRRRVRPVLDDRVAAHPLQLRSAARRRVGARAREAPRRVGGAPGRLSLGLRPHRHAPRRLEAADTGDALWNAAQTQLVREGRLHNTLRMLWGKKILEWSPSPRRALARMIHLNNKYGLDGRDPNCYSGIFWVLGRYDRPWPERPIFGIVRAMTSASTARKVRVRAYVRRHGERQS